MILEMINNPIDKTMLSILMLIVLGCGIGLLINRARAQFYSWILGVVIRINLFICALYFSWGISKFRIVCMDVDGNTVFPSNAIYWFLETVWALMGIVHFYIVVSLIAFLIKTFAEIKQKYAANQQLEPICPTSVDSDND
jgi:predicted Na+-dependent transporter